MTIENCCIEQNGKNIFSQPLVTSEKVKLGDLTFYILSTNDPSRIIILNGPSVSNLKNQVGPDCPRITLINNGPGSSELSISGNGSLETSFNIGRSKYTLSGKITPKI